MHDKKITAKKLTGKQRLFVEAYQGDARGNATEAARLAGYKGNARTLCQVGAENLRKPNIQRALADLAAASPLVLSRQQIQEELSVMALDPKAQLKDRLKALDQLAKTQGLYLERREVELRGGLQVVAYFPKDGREREDGDA
jgi:hypothetical protein